MTLTSAKILIAAAAVAATTAFIPLTSASAQTQDECVTYARAAARDAHPQRGPILGLVSIPFEVTGALLTGRTSGDFAWKTTFNRAYSDCMNGRTAAVYVPVRPRAMAMNDDYCAAKYRSYNPSTGTYVTYSGEVRSCP